MRVRGGIYGVQCRSLPDVRGQGNTGDAGAMQAVQGKWKGFPPKRNMPRLSRKRRDVKHQRYYLSRKSGDTPMQALQRNRIHPAGQGKLRRMQGPRRTRQKDRMPLLSGRKPQNRRGPPAAATASRGRASRSDRSGRGMYPLRPRRKSDEKGRMYAVRQGFQSQEGIQRRQRRVQMPKVRQGLRRPVYPLRMQDAGLPVLRRAEIRSHPLPHVRRRQNYHAA